MKMPQEVVNVIGAWRVSLLQIIEDEDHQEYLQNEKEGSDLRDYLTSLHDEMVAALKDHESQGCCSDVPE